MKSLKWGLVLLTLPGALFAQPLPGSVEAGVGAGRFFGGSFARGSNDLFDQKVEADDDILKGFWLAAQLSRGWGLEVAVRRTATHLVEPQGGVFPSRPTVAIFNPATVELLGIRSFPYGNFVPYAGFGIGFMNISGPEEGDNDPSIRDVNRLCLSITGGARFYAARWIGARIDARGRGTYLGVRRLGADRGITDTGRWFFNGELLGGIFLSFGGRS